MSLSWWAYLPALLVIGWLTLGRYLRWNRPTSIFSRGQYVAGTDFTPEEIGPVIAQMVAYSYGYTPSPRLASQFARDVVEEAKQVHAIR